MKSKKHYSVKEAAKILDVSTNTIYSYLEKGTIRAKRLGRGRFKILAADLAPYLTPAREAVRPLFDFNFDKGRLHSLLGRDAGHEVKGNFLFWRMYIAYLMLAVGIIHLFWRPNLLLSLPLAVGGILTLYISENWRQHLALSRAIHLFDLLVLILASIIAFLSGNYYMILFLGSAAICTFAQNITGVNKLSEEGSLVGVFAGCTAIATVLLGLIAVIKPGFLPAGSFQVFVAQYKILFLLILTLMTIPLLHIHYVIFKSHFRERSHLEFFIIPVYGIGSLIVASIYSNLGIWDMAYAAFFYAFLAFVVMWLRKAGSISSYFKNGLLITFGWIGVAIVIGIFSMYLIQERLKSSNLKSMSVNLNSIVNDINDYFTMSESAITAAVTESSLPQILASKSKAGAQDFAMSLYDKLSYINRVLVYDSEGIAIGVYPRSSITEGTNFSSRDYFQAAKSSTKPYLSSLFESVVGSRTVLYAVPVFLNVRFLGEVGVAFHLEALSEKFQTSTPTSNVFAYDKAGKYVLNSDESKIGQNVPEVILKNFEKSRFETDSSLFACEPAGVPEWRVCKESPVSATTQVLYISNIVFIIFLFVNATQSLRAGFLLSDKSKKHV